MTTKMVLLAQILDDTIFHYENQAYELDYSMRPGLDQVCIKNLVTNECLIVHETTEVEIRTSYNKKKTLVWPKKAQSNND